MFGSEMLWAIEHWLPLADLPFNIQPNWEDVLWRVQFWAARFWKKLESRFFFLFLF